MWKDQIRQLDYYDAGAVFTEGQMIDFISTEIIEKLIEQEHEYPDLEKHTEGFKLGYMAAILAHKQQLRRDWLK
jgi:hypothetical protein